MNELIENIFDLMLNASVDQIDKLTKSSIVFKNGMSLSIRQKRTDEETEVLKPMTLQNLSCDSGFWAYYWYFKYDVNSKLIFIINTPFRDYTLPEITDRHTYAETLNRLDKLISDYECQYLTEGRKFFINNKRDYKDDLD